MGMTLGIKTPDNLFILKRCLSINDSGPAAGHSQANVLQEPSLVERKFHFIGEGESWGRGGLISRSPHLYKAKAFREFQGCIGGGKRLRRHSSPLPVILKLVIQ